MYEERIIAFVDILGFKKMVNEYDEEEIKSILSIPKEYFDSDSLKCKYEGIQVSLFSDSIIISFKYTEEHAVYILLLDLLNILISFIHKGVVCRGAIIKGEVIHNKDFLYGPGFNEVYKMEEEIKNPKVGFNEEIYDIGCKYHDPKKSKELEKNFIKTLCAKDSDGSYYIDYIVSPISSVINVRPIDRKDYLERLLEIITKGLKDKDEEIRGKYAWMKEKYINALDNLLEFFDVLYEEVLEEVFKNIRKADVVALKNKILNITQE